MERKTQYEGFSPSLRTTAIFVFNAVLPSTAPQTDLRTQSLRTVQTEIAATGTGRSRSLTSGCLLTRTPWASREALVDDLSKDQALPCTQHVSTVLKSLCEVYFKNSWRSFDSPKRMCAPYYLAVRFIYPSQIACRIIARACKRKQGGN